MSDNETLKELFCADWVWLKEEGTAEFFKAVGMPEWVIDWEINSKASMNMTMEADGNLCTVIEANGPGGQKMKFEEKMKLGETRTVKDNKDAPKLISKFTMTMEDKKLKDVVQPELPPGKTYNVSTERVGDEMQSTYSVKNDDGQLVTAKRVFTLKK